ncbi:MAG: tRNA (adenosine(37)-N6)-dimethylallyltransferase MiaA [Deltaproteobacteria bacterium]|nr:tRNA (adenosine(37)-N6)-dimethylallyltransferase MiaA [Deltaproteobacteria bacterium]
MTRLVVIVGPTASGKTRLAVDLARRTGGEVVSADSQQVYAGMDIGTGKATADERAAVPHHLIDIVAPDDTMTAARFITLADAAIADIAARGRPVIVCGGTGLYIRALLLGLFEGPPADAALRAELDAAADAHGTAHLHARLAAIDPAMARKIDPHDQKRLVRALEVHQLTGVPMSEHQARHDHRTAAARYPHVLVGLSPERATLHARIEARVDAMIAAGLVDEVAGLRARGFAPPMRSQGAIGYAEVHDHLAGVHSLATMIELIKRNSRRYARRQISWHRPDPLVRWHSEASDVDLGSLERYLGS